MAEKKISKIVWLIRDRSFSLTLLVILLLVSSLGSWFSIPIEVMPKDQESSSLFLTIKAIRSMAPEQMENALTIPVEGAIKTVGNLQSFSTTTTETGVSLTLMFRAMTDLNLSTISIMESLQALDGKANFDFGQVSISRDNPDASAVAKIAVTGLKSKKDADDLRSELEVIPEISKVEFFGVTDPTLDFILPASRAAAVGMGGSKAAHLLNLQNFADVLGSINLENTNKLIPVRAEMRFLDLDEVKKFRVGQKRGVLLGDLLVEKNKDEKDTAISRVNGHETVFIEIYNREKSNLFELNKHLRNYFNSKKAAHDRDGLIFEMIFNKTDDLKAAIADVFEALWQSILVTFFVVYLFLRKWRQTFIISVSIPVTLTLTVLILFTKGVSLNVLTLSGLILGLGMVVDNVVLVIGRIEELGQQKFNSRSAAAFGAQQVAGALLMSTITNACIFLPVAFVEGGDSFTDILKAFQVPILVSLVASLFVALFIIPLLSILWPAKHASVNIHKEAAFDKSSLTAIFKKIQNNRVWVSVFCLVVVFGLIRWTSGIQQTDLETPREHFSTINVAFSPEMPSPQRQKEFEKFEKLVLEKKENLRFQFAVSDFNSKYTSGSLVVFPPDVADKEDYLKGMDERIQTLLQEIRFPPGVSASLGWSFAMSSKVRGFDMFSVAGPKTGVAKELTIQFKEKASGLNGVEEVLLDSEISGAKGMMFRPNEIMLNHYGLNLGNIQRELSSKNLGASLSQLRTPSGEAGLHIQLQDGGAVPDLAALMATQIPSESGALISLADLGYFEPVRFKNSLSRKEGISTSRVTVYYKDGISTAQRRDLRSQLNGIFQQLPFPAGYGAPKSDSEARVAEMQSKTNFILLLSLFLIYLVLGGMLESFFTPFAILFTVPLALLFGAGGLVLFGMDLDVMARLALVILVGSGVNASIILIDMINALRKQGMSRSEAVIRGCANRFHAVMMSTCIQVIGVLPIALGKAKILGIPYASLGIAIMSGMLFSTLATLVVLPMLYELMDDLQNKVHKFFFNQSGSDSVG